MKSGELLLIGIDGGATEVKSHHIIAQKKDERTTFSLGKATSSRKYKFVKDFTPVPIQTQLNERNNNDVKLTPMEIAQSDNYIQATYETVADIIKETGIKNVLIGMGMPGLKTPDNRGINMIIHGARLPNFLDLLEDKIAKEGITLINPIYKLGSDADYCGIGEEYAEEGLFKDIQNSYYLGGGTGVADAMKLDGELVTFDSAKSWIQKSWQIMSSVGITYEKGISAKSVIALYTNIIRCSQEEIIEKGKFPEIEAKKGDIYASFVMSFASQLLAELIFERIYTIKNGREELSYRGEAYLNLDKKHPYKGTLLDRIIMGQRIGRIYSEKEFENVLKKPTEEILTKMIQDFGDEEMKKHYLGKGKIKDGIIASSNLRAAPAIGAAIDAYRYYKLKTEDTDKINLDKK